MPSNLSFTLCPAPGTAATCLLPPGEYTAPIHDAYVLTIKAAGWQEERASLPDEDESMTILSRTAARDQRLTIDTGQTSEILDDGEMAALVAGTAPFQSSAPVAATVGSAWGYQVDLAPTKTEEVSIDGADTYTLQAGHRYRLMALQEPMQEESGIKVVIVDSPSATFDAFLPLAMEVLKTVRFATPT